LTSKDLIVGLDVSTSCTGISIVNGDGSLIEAEYVYLSDAIGNREKASLVRTRLLRLQNTYGDRVAAVAVEQNLLGFRRGASSALTLITLARFNGVVSMIAGEVFNVPVYTVPVNDARRSLGIVTKRGDDVKAAVFSWVSAQEPSRCWPTRRIERGPRRGTDVLEKGVEDACDAYVIARAFITLRETDKIRRD